VRRGWPWLVGPLIGTIAAIASMVWNLGATDTAVLMMVALIVTLTVGLREIAWAVEDGHPPRYETQIAPGEPIDMEALRELAFSDKVEPAPPAPAPRRRRPATEEDFQGSVRQLRDGGKR
jgi:hypothetical protein